MGSAAARAAAGEPAPAPRPLSRTVLVGAAVVAALALVPLVLALRGGDEPQDAPTAAAPGPGTAPGPAGDPASVDLASMSPRDAADRLFNRVMQSVSAGDSTQAAAFLPMAVSAYERVSDLDLDGHYHFAILQLVAGDAAAARAQADSILAVEPDHLFGLFTAAQAEAARGNHSEARELYARFLESYDAEIARDRLEYREHAQVLPLNRDEARTVVQAD